MPHYASSKAGFPIKAVSIYRLDQGNRLDTDLIKETLLTYIPTN